MDLHAPEGLIDVLRGLHWVLDLLQLDVERDAALVRWATSEGHGGQVDDCSGYSLWSRWMMGRVKVVLRPEGVLDYIRSHAVWPMLWTISA